MQVIGHRGAAALAPENTWYSFDTALEIGVDAIETDVRATSDGELVLLHDANLNRTTNGSGPVNELPWSTVSQLDAGSWFDKKYSAARIPLLQKTLEHYGERIPFVLEIKQPGIEERVVEMVNVLGLLPRITFTSFNFETAEYVKQIVPAAKVGFLTSNTDRETIQRVLVAQLDQFCPPAAAVTPELVSGWKTLGLEVRAWGVKDVAIMQNAIQAGVDGMTVDFPHLLMEALGRGSQKQ